MRLMSILFLSCLALFSPGYDRVCAQEQRNGTRLEEGNSATGSMVKIIAEPKSSRPFDWKSGEKVTVGVRCISDDETRIVGIATGVELVATKTFANRVEMALRGDTAAIKRIEAAAKISEYWFEVMPYREEHRKTLERDVDLNQFLEKHSAFRPLDESRWGYGAPGGKLQPPTKDELPLRR